MALGVTSLTREIAHHDGDKIVSDLFHSLWHAPPIYCTYVGQHLPQSDHHQSPDGPSPLLLFFGNITFVN